MRGGPLVKKLRRRMASDALMLGGPRIVLPKQSCLRTASTHLEKSARFSNLGPSFNVHLGSRCSRKGVGTVRAHSVQDDTMKGALPNAVLTDGRRQVLLALAAAASAIAAHNGRANAAGATAAEGNKKFTDSESERMASLLTTFSCIGIVPSLRNSCLHL